MMFIHASLQEALVLNSRGRGDDDDNYHGDDCGNGDDDDYEDGRRGRLYDNGIDRLTRGCAPQTTLERELRSQFEFSRDGVGDHFPSSECHFASSELKFVNTGTWL